jgi:ubiquitin-protein ligase
MLKFISKVYHPRIRTETGETCILAYSFNEWVPSKKIVDILEFINTKLVSILSDWDIKDLTDYISNPRRMV